MSRAALIDSDGLVVNVIEIPDGGLPPGWTSGSQIVRLLEPEAKVGPGWVLEGDSWTAPPTPPEPEPGPDPVVQLRADLDATNAVLAGALNLLGTFQGGA